MLSLQEAAVYRDGTGQKEKHRRLEYQIQNLRNEAFTFSIHEFTDEFT